MNTRLLCLLLGWLLAASAAAQPARAGGPALVDSRDECAALDGKWKPGAEGWRSACELPWSREDCLQRGGAWSQDAKAASGGRCRAVTSELATAQQCMDHGGDWAPAGARPPQCTFEQPGTRKVSRKAPDAGKQCSSQKECTYGCAYQGPAVARGAEVPGRCRATNDAAGCFSMVEAGKSTGRVCVN